ncbi:MAG: carbohydrate ABC transporter permease, partial [Chloroflexota bacterium]|nr:carbohydrate ABC transporter permease [Chloroflexota bacterium]
MAIATEPMPQAETRVTGAHAKRTTFDSAVQVLAYVVLILVAFTMFIPFIFSVATSLKTNAEILNLNFANMFWPENATLQAFRTVGNSDIRVWFGNSVLVAAIWVISRAVFDSMAGYAFARMQFPGKNLVFLMILSTLMVPGIVTIIPKFLILRDLGLLNGYGALTVPFLTDAFGIFLMKQFFESIPIELEEAARVDGASRYRMFIQIILPNAAPAF